MRYEETLHIDRPVGEVFAYASDPTNLPEWDTDVRDGRVVGDGPVSVGTEIEVTRTVPPFDRVGTFSGRVTVHEPDDRFAVVMDDGPIPFDLEYRFREEGSGTALDVTVQSRPRGLLGLIEPLVAGSVRRQVAGHYAGLVRVLEAGRTESNS